MLDRYVYGRVERVSYEAPIPVLAIEREEVMPGGAGNVARNIAALGATAVLIGLVGADPAAALLRERLKSEGRIVDRLVVDAERPTTTKTRYVAGSQQLLRADGEKPAPTQGKLAEALLAAYAAELAAADVVVVSDYAKGVLSDAVLKSCIALARQNGKQVLVDPKSRDFRRYAGASVLKPNREEVRAATGLPCDSDAEAAAAARKAIEIAEVRAVLVSRAQAGMTLVSAGGAVLHLPAEAREVFDVSGAGDTVMATFAVALSVGFDLPQAARLANMAGGIVVGKVGTAVVHAADLAQAIQAEVLHSTEAKIVPLEVACERVQAWRARGERIAFTNGCFDLVHPGHVSLLAQAKAAADRLIVGLNSDASVRRLKGASRPVQSEAARAVVLASLAAVDLVVIFAEDTPIPLLEALKPDILVKGGQYALDEVVGADVVQAYGGRVVRAEMVAGYSTTDTIARLTG